MSTCSNSPITDGCLLESSPTYNGEQCRIWQQLVVPIHEKLLENVGKLGLTAAVFKNDYGSKFSQNKS